MQLNPAQKQTLISVRVLTCFLNAGVGHLWTVLLDVCSIYPRKDCWKNPPCFIWLPCRFSELCHPPFINTLLPSTAIHIYTEIYPRNPSKPLHFGGKGSPNPVREEKEVPLAARSRFMECAIRRFEWKANRLATCGPVYSGECAQQSWVTVTWEQAWKQPSEFGYILLWLH